ncbi:MAG: orotidine 5'-phosphate decarboxylase [Verrucomicrobia bacterium]|nr:orotidine 5'-phosphate decarboxylase [Verrucomicrobiota bacterium]
MNQRVRLQVAVDVTSLDEAVRVVEHIGPYVDIVEVGTPLIFEAGLEAVATLKVLCPGRQVLADLKIVDAGYIEARGAFRRGADIVTVLGVADEATINGALRAAREAGGQIMVDLLQVADEAARARELAGLGVTCFCLHTAYDRQGTVDPLAKLHAVRGAVAVTLAVAGGLGPQNVSAVVADGADIVVVGGAIVAQPDPAAAAAHIMTLLTEATHE